MQGHMELFRAAMAGTGGPGARHAAQAETPQASAIAHFFGKLNALPAPASKS